MEKSLEISTREILGEAEHNGLRDEVNQGWGKISLNYFVNKMGQDKQDHFGWKGSCEQRKGGEDMTTQAEEGEEIGNADR